MRRFCAILTVLLLTVVTLTVPCHGRANPPIDVDPIPSKPSTTVGWSIKTRLITVTTAQECRVILAEYDEDGRMVRVRVEGTENCRCAFSDDAEGTKAVVFTVGEDGTPLGLAFDISWFAPWSQ